MADYSPCCAFTGAESNLPFWTLLGREILPTIGVAALPFELPQPILLESFAAKWISPRLTLYSLLYFLKSRRARALALRAPAQMGVARRMHTHTYTYTCLSTFTNPHPLWSGRLVKVMVLLDNDGVSLLTTWEYVISFVTFIYQFLSGVTKLFQQTRNSGSIFLTMKKCKLTSFP